MSENLRLSVSKTKTFIQCKKQYQFSYILKLPKKDHDYHIFGKFCHKVLEDFHNAYLIGSLLPYNEVMSQAFKDAVIEFNKQMTSNMKKDCWKIIDQYLRLVSSDKKNNLTANVLAVEKKFDFSLTENVVLNGMIDRIQLDADGILHVADYKTTKNKKYLKNDFFQLLTYAFVLLSNDPTIKKVRASYILLRHDYEYITAEFSVDEIMKVKDQYIEYAKQINEETEFAPNPTFLCGYCDFLESCDAGREKVNTIRPALIYGEVGW